MQFCEIRITKEPLDTAAPATFRGPKVLWSIFSAWFESIENERMIDGIEYEAFEAMAERQLVLIADEAKRPVSDLFR